MGDVKTNWMDLMLWAVMAGQPEIAQHCWAKTAEPMRAAIWAAHLAFAVSRVQLNSTDDGMIIRVSGQGRMPYQACCAKLMRCCVVRAQIHNDGMMIDQTIGEVKLHLVHGESWPSRNQTFLDGTH